MQPIRQPWTRTAALIGSILAALVWITVCVAWLAGVWWYAQPWYLSIPAAVMLPPCFGLLLAQSWTLILRPFLVGRYFGRALAEVSPSQLRPGETMELRYERPVRSEVDVRRVVTRLVLRESVRRYQHDGRITLTHDR